MKIKIFVLALSFAAFAFSGMDTTFASAQNQNQIQKIPIESKAAVQFSHKREYNTPFFALSDYERWLVESVVAGEAGNQEYLGKVAVANCILNACVLDDIQPSEVRKKYQYAGWFDIGYYSTVESELAQEVKNAVAQVFDKGELISSEILWFYNPNHGYSSFHENQTQYYFTIDSHKFFGMK